MTRFSFLVLLAALLSMACSCDYRLYAPSEHYPDNYVYQPLALDGVCYVSSLDTTEPDLPTDGFVPNVRLDAERSKLVFLMGVVQSGMDLKACSVRVKVNNSLVNEMLRDGLLEVGVLPMPEAAYSLPASVMMSPGKASSSYTFEVDTKIFQTKEYYGKTLAIAVAIDSEDIAVNEEASTVVFVIDSNEIPEL